MRKPYQMKMLLAAPLLAGTLLLGGCSSVQFEGAIFERLGLGEEQQKAETRMPDRAPLVVPPRRDLPTPGPRQVVSNPDAWPDDPNIALKKQAAEKKLAEKRHCSEGTWRKKASMRDFQEFHDPLLRCKGLGLDGKDLPDELRADGSPDTVVERPDGVTTRKEDPTPWRNETTQARSAQ